MKSCSNYLTTATIFACRRNRILESHFVSQFNIQELPVDLIFVLWWSFIEPSTKNSFYLSTLDLFNSEFHSHLITYLASTPTLWQEVTLRFNWILKREFLKALKNLPDLKHLTLLGSCHSEVLKLIAGKFKLMKLSLTGPLMNIDKALTPETFAVFLRSQPHLQELDLTSFHSTGFDLTHEVIITAFKACPNIRKCILSRQLCQTWIDRGFQSPLEHIQEIHLLDNSPEQPQIRELSLWISRVFPNVKRMVWREAVLLGPDMLHFRHFYPLLTDLRVMVKGHSVRLYEVLSQCCHLKRASFDLSAQGSTTSDIALVRSATPHPSLTDVSITCHPRLGFDDLYYLFSKCPKLATLMIVTEQIENLEERPLIKALQGGSLMELKCLRLQILNRTFKPCTSSLLFAICECIPELTYFKNLAIFSFAHPSVELRKLEELARRRSLQVVYHERRPLLWMA
ncbi:uncharacterized protein LOC131891420 isoform X2 [Tigriopus californicus]|uniref:uncharacterized protein LOC131891420 isoform X2 n=1 Tax=Tigriopus californicus TaxID=6832 RepID=UPI0027D9D8C8|nr:uncharacterized protein LOC131891420 isoform X2 [Tigriopus californicus]